jgi:peptide deformylase
MRILSYPEPFLRRKARPVKEIAPELLNVLPEMFQVMYAARGVGLAATQVGMDLAVFVLNMTGEPDQELVFFNPEIIAADGESVEIEGCLSLPGLEAKVRRSAQVRVRALDIHGEPFELEGAGFLARALQHEIDHLCGALFIDKIGQAARISLKTRLKELEDRYSADSA